MTNSLYAKRTLSSRSFSLLFIFAFLLERFYYELHSHHVVKIFYFIPLRYSCYHTQQTGTYVESRPSNSSSSQVITSK